MIAGCYTLDLYCGNETVHGFMLTRPLDDESSGTLRGGYAQYIGRTFADCARQATGHGWRISRCKTMVYCPHCGGKKARAALAEKEG